MFFIGDFDIGLFLVVIIFFGFGVWWGMVSRAKWIENLAKKKDKRDE